MAFEALTFAKSGTVLDAQAVTKKATLQTSITDREARITNLLSRRPLPRKIDRLVGQERALLAKDQEDLTAVQTIISNIVDVDTYQLTIDDLDFFGF